MLSSSQFDLPIESFHTKIVFPSTGRPGNVAQSSCCQHQGGLPIRKNSDDSRPSPDLAHQSFQRIVGPDAAPMCLRETVVAECLRDTLTNFRCGYLLLHLRKLLGDLLHLCEASRFFLNPTRIRARLISVMLTLTPCWSYIQAHKSLSLAFGLRVT